MSYFNPNLPDVVARSLFLKYDTDNSGGLSGEELKRFFMDDLGLNNEQAQAYVLLLDTDGNSDVSFDEFAAWLRSGENLQTINDSSRYQRVRRAVDLFKQFDTDNNQSLDKNEFKQVFVSSGGRPSHFHKIFKNLDYDKNGVISFQEFLEWLNWVPMDAFQ